MEPTRIDVATDPARKRSFLAAPALARSIAPVLAVVSLGCGASHAPRWTPPRAPDPVQVVAPPSSGAAPILPESASRVTFARIAKFPEPGWQVPRAIRVSPDGKLTTYLESEDGSEKMALFALDDKGPRVLVRASDLGAGKESRAEELRAERQRRRITGIAEYAWADDANVIVMPAGGDVFVRLADGAIQRVTDTPDPEIDPRLCPNGKWVAYARGSELYATNLETKKEQPITRGAKAGTTRGQSDFNGQEEFDEEHGFWWSKDCKRLAYLEVDESGVAEVPVMGYRKDAPDLMMQRYPLAGAANPKVTLYVYDFDAGAARAVTFPTKDPLYLGRLHFAPDGGALFLEALPRSQKELDVYRVDLPRANAKLLWSEKPVGWAEMNDLEVAAGGKELVLIADHGGHDHLLRLDASSGKELGWLTSGDWDVTSLARVYDPPGTAYFVGTKDDPIGRQLYAVPLAGGAPITITPEPGTHEVAMGPNQIVDLASSTTTPPHASILTMKGEPTATLPIPPDPEIQSLGLRAPGLFSVDVAGGTKLYGHVLAPRDLDPSKKYPLVLMVYGGPGVQTVMDRWSPGLLWQELADRGFFVAELDNRGGSGRGQAFAAPIAGQLGKIELEDQLAGLDWLTKHAPIDPARVAIYGHSYGGFMAALGMFEAPDRFKAGVSGSPVTDFRLYDTGYTERFLGAPTDDKAGYDGTDVVKNAANLRGRFFLIHNLMDENVHFDNAARLIDALVAADKPFDLLVLPGERHGYRDPKTKEYVYRRIATFLADALAP